MDHVHASDKEPSIPDESEFVQVLGISTQKLSPASSSARSQHYRDELKKDPVRYELHRLKNMERSAKAYHRPKTKEELEHLRELSRIRSQRYRDNRKAAKSSDEPCGPPMPQTENDKEILREQWRNTKTLQRSRWSSERKRLHREKTLANYHKRKEKLHSETETEIQACDIKKEVIEETVTSLSSDDRVSVPVMDCSSNEYLRLLGVSPLETPLTNSARCKRYREDLKKDPEKYELHRLMNMERSAKAYHRPKTKEELEHLRELSRIRSQRYRENKKAAMTSGSDEPTSVSCSNVKLKPEALNDHDKELLREQWRLAKKLQRSKRSLETKRLHQDKALVNYYKHKAVKMDADEKARDVSSWLEFEPSNSAHPDTSIS